MSLQMSNTAIKGDTLHHPHLSGKFRDIERPFRSVLPTYAVQCGSELNCARRPGLDPRFSYRLGIVDRPLLRR